MNQGRILKADLDYLFPLSRLGSGTPDNAGTVTLIRKRRFREDFLIMFVHHLATIGLITFSYINNMVRVGTLVMCLHDASDFLLEAAKLANYAKYQRLCDTLFVIFSAIFVVTRLGIYPFWILNTTLFESWEMIGPYPSWWLFNGLLLILQVLHVIWSYLIARIAFKALIRGK
ncbi:Ceramide synthase 5, partial [Eschrichtius robustus]|nr:Ceramide synthase 5 [Eschrichtius robustus]